MLNSRWLLSSALIASALHGFCAAAQGTHCTNALGDVEVRGNLDITSRCELTGTSVRGNVTLFSGGSLIARDVNIRGNLVARRADFVAIEDSEIDGNVTLDELVGDNSSIENTEIDGNASLTSNRSALEILNNEIDGNVQASGNSGGVSISGNSIDGNLECSGNTPAPVGLGNRVEKRSQGQCENLRPQASIPRPPRRGRATSTLPASFTEHSARDDSTGHRLPGHDAAYAFAARRTERQSHDQFALRRPGCDGDGLHRRRPDVADRRRESREHRPPRHFHGHLLRQRSVRQCRDARDAQGHRGTAAGRGRRRRWQRRLEFALALLLLLIGRFDSTQERWKQSPPLRLRRPVWRPASAAADGEFSLPQTWPQWHERTLVSIGRGDRI